MDPNKKNQIRTIGECIDQMMDKSVLGKRLQRPAMKEAWKELTGDSISKRTQDLWISDGKLIVRTSSGSIKHFLLSNRSKILTQIKDKLPGVEIEDLVIL